MTFDSARYRTALDTQRGALARLPGVSEADLEELARSLRRNRRSFQDALADLVAPGEVLALLTLARGIEPRGETTRLDALPRADEPLFYAGDLEIAGNALNADGLTVLGDLRVAGNLLEGGTYARLAVSGNVTVGSVMTEYDAVVAGDFTASGVVYGTYNDHVMLVGGTLEAPVVIEDDHAILATRRTVSYRVSDGTGWKRLEPVLVPEILDLGGFDTKAFRTLLRARKAVLREGAIDAGPVLDARLQGLLDLARASSSFTFESVSGKPALRVVRADGSRQLSLLTADEEKTLRARLA